MKKIFFIIVVTTALLFSPIALAADNFTANQIQGVFGEFTAVLDEAVSGNAFSGNNVQGVFGQFVPVFDEAAGTTTTYQPRPPAINASGNSFFSF